jgi:hypothetical protein
VWWLEGGTPISNTRVRVPMGIWWFAKSKVVELALNWSRVLSRALLSSPTHIPQPSANILLYLVGYIHFYTGLCLYSKTWICHFYCVFYSKTWYLSFILCVFTRKRDICHLYCVFLLEIVICHLYCVCTRKHDICHFYCVFLLENMISVIYIVFFLLENMISVIYIVFFYSKTWYLSFIWLVTRKHDICHLYCVFYSKTWYLSFILCLQHDKFLHFFLDSIKNFTLTLTLHLLIHIYLYIYTHDQNNNLKLDFNKLRFYRNSIE